MGERTHSAIIPGIVPDRHTRPAPRVYVCPLCDEDLTSEDCRIVVVGVPIDTETGAFRVSVHLRCDPTLDDPEEALGLF